MTKLLPYENYIIESPLTADQLLVKLLEKTLTPQEYVSESDKQVFSFGLKGWSKPYWGNIRNDSFELERLINYRNFGNPKIFGLIQRRENGTYVKITMRPEGFWLGFVSLCILGFLYALVVSIIQSIKAGEMQLGVLVASGLFVFTYLLLLVSFRVEAVKSKIFLKDLSEKVDHPVTNAANTGLPN